MFLHFLFHRVHEKNEECTKRAIAYDRANHGQAHRLDVLRWIRINNTRLVCIFKQLQKFLTLLLVRSLTIGNDDIPVVVLVSLHLSALMSFCDCYIFARIFCVKKQCVYIKLVCAKILAHSLSHNMLHAKLSLQLTK